MNQVAKQIVRSFVEEYQEGRDEAAFRRYLSPDVLDHTPMPGVAPGADGVSQVFQMLCEYLKRFSCFLTILANSPERPPSSAFLIFGSVRMTLFVVGNLVNCWLRYSSS